MIHVCCLMPTWNRREFIPRALDCFQKQRHPADWKLELIVLDDGTDKILDIMQQFPDPRIRYVQLDGPKLTLGAKLNIGCGLFKADYFVTYDDDDWHSPERVYRQVGPMVDTEAMITGTSVIVYRDVNSGRVFRYSGKSEEWIGAIAFRRKAWERHPFGDRNGGVDTIWMRHFTAKEKHDLRDDSLLLASIHPANTCRKRTSDRTRWCELPAVPEYLL